MYTFLYLVSLIYLHCLLEPGRRTSYASTVCIHGNPRPQQSCLWGGGASAHWWSRITILNKTRKLLLVLIGCKKEEILTWISSKYWYTCMVTADENNIFLFILFFFSSFVELTLCEVARRTEKSFSWLTVKDYNQVSNMKSNIIIWVPTFFRIATVKFTKLPWNIQYIHIVSKNCLGISSVANMDLMHRVLHANTLQLGYWNPH